MRAACRPVFETRRCLRCRKRKTPRAIRPGELSPNDPCSFCPHSLFLSLSITLSLPFLPN